MESLRIKKCKTSEHEPMSHEEKEMFFISSQINDRIEEKSQNKYLLCRHHDMFSNYKTDLGKAINFEY